MTELAYAPPSSGLEAMGSRVITILPMAFPDCCKAWASFSDSRDHGSTFQTGVFSLQASIREATACKISCWRAISSVSCIERANMNSQQIETALGLNLSRFALPMLVMLTILPNGLIMSQN